MAVSSVVTISCGRSGRVTRAKEKTAVTGLWKDMDFNQILFGVCGNCHLSDRRAQHQDISIYI